MKGKNKMGPDTGIDPITVDTSYLSSDTYWGSLGLSNNPITGNRIGSWQPSAGSSNSGTSASNTSGGSVSTTGSSVVTSSGNSNNNNSNNTNESSENQACYQASKAYSKAPAGAEQEAACGRQ